MGGANQARGAHGEELVARWYAERGYEVLDRNWRLSRVGELDLVLGRPAGRTGTRLVVFCEVKTRTSTAFGHPFEAVSPAKLERVRRLGQAWLVEHGMRRARTRVDVAAVLGAGRAGDADAVIEVLHDL